ncbi:MAG: hypothetical protein EBS23_07615 [Betaproteobacteria bacterium]|nr:hypothetical protein [Betaproteobacteria bacterium]
MCQCLAVDLDEAQTLCSILLKHGFDQRRLAGTPRAGKQHIIGRLAGDELLGVARKKGLLQIDAVEVGEADHMSVSNRIAAPPLPEEGGCRIPVDGFGTDTPLKGVGDSVEPLQQPL